MGEPNSTSLQIGPYQTTRRISRSMHQGMYLARHKETAQAVKLRVITITDKDYDPIVEQCKAILADAQAVQSPYLVSIEDFGGDGPLLYIATRTVNGGTLLERMAWRNIGTKGSDAPHLPSVGEVLAIAEPIAHALDAIHDEGIVHGQLDPEAIMFDTGAALLADIGLTRLLKVLYRLDSTNSFSMNRYTPPELWDGERPQPATDQYSLACIVYELLTGQAAFPGKSIYEIKEAHNNHIPKPPHLVRPELPQTLGIVFWQALTKSLDRRFHSVTAFYDQLARAAGDDLGTPTDFATFVLD